MKSFPDTSVSLVVRSSIQAALLGLAFVASTYTSFAEEPAAGEAAATPPAPSGPSATLQEIVVTAERKTESAQRTAVAIDVVSGPSLTRQGIDNSYGLTKVTPALTLTNGGGSNTSLYINGVGNKTSNSYLDPAIAVSYDGVFLSRAGGVFGAAFFDLARVEVLKGPQGILYGKNATGGAINIIPNTPHLHRTSGGATASVGNYGTVDAQTHINLPVGDKVALRFAAAHQSHNGYNHDGSDDQDTNAARAQVLYVPSDALSMRLAADYTHLGGEGAQASYIGNFTRNPSGGYLFTPSNLDINDGMGTAAANAYRSTLLGAPGFGYLTPLNAKPRQDYTYWGANSEIQYRSTAGTLTLIPAYRVSEGSSTFSGPAFNMAMTHETDRQYSFEGRFAGSAGAIDYLVGTYYLHETLQYASEYNQEFILPIQGYGQLAKSWAGFGQLTAHITHRLRLIGGARYTRDFKEFSGVIDNFITFCGGTPPTNLSPPASFAHGCSAPGSLPRYPDFLSVQSTMNWLIDQGWISPASRDTSAGGVFPLLDGVGTIAGVNTPVQSSGYWSRPTWKASAEYDLAPHSMLFATYETGYRAGGFQLASSVPRYAPEYLDAYTVGSKNRFLGGRLQINADAFLWKYRNQQVTYFTVAPAGTLISATENAGRMTIDGADIDVTAKVTPRATMDAKIQYLHTVYDSFDLYTAPPRDNFDCPHTLTGKFSGGAPVEDFNCAKKPGLFSPKWTASLGLEQYLWVVDDYDLVGNVDTAWRDTEYGGFEYLDFEKIPAYFTTDLDLTLENSLNNWSVGLYALNLQNVRREDGPQLAPTGQAVSTFSAPLTFGVRLSMAF